MTPGRKEQEPSEPAPSPYFRVILTADADGDLGQISDTATREVILRRALELRTEPLKQGKPLTGALKHYRSVRASGQRYRIVYQVAVTAGKVVVAVIGIRKAGSKQDAYAVAEKRLK